MRPRSGLSPGSGLTVLNAPGTIDSDYRGEVQVLLVNLGDAPVTMRRSSASRSSSSRRSRGPSSSWLDGSETTSRGQEGWGRRGAVEPMFRACRTWRDTEREATGERANRTKSRLAPREVARGRRRGVELSRDARREGCGRTRAARAVRAEREGVRRMGAWELGGEPLSPRARAAPPRARKGRGGRPRRRPSLPLANRSSTWSARVRQSTLAHGSSSNCSTPSRCRTRTASSTARSLPEHLRHGRGSLRLADFASPPSLAARRGPQAARVVLERIGLFSAPERCIAAALPPSESTDIWSVGRVSLLRDDGAGAHDEREAPSVPLRAAAPGVPEDVAAVVSFALSADPDDRYESAYAMLGDVRRILVRTAPEALGRARAGSVAQRRGVGAMAPPRLWRCRRLVRLCSRRRRGALEAVPNDRYRVGWRGNVLLVVASRRAGRDWRHSSPCASALSTRSREGPARDDLAPHARRAAVASRQVP